MPSNVTSDDRKWEAESDARTLSEANVILEDDKRLKAAQKAAVSLAKDAKASFEGMMKVAGKGAIVEGMKIINKD